MKQPGVVSEEEARTLCLKQRRMVRVSLIVGRKHKVYEVDVETEAHMAVGIKQHTCRHFGFKWCAWAGFGSTLSGRRVFEEQAVMKQLEA